MANVAFSGKFNQPASVRSYYIVLLHNKTKNVFLYKFLFYNFFRLEIMDKTKTHIFSSIIIINKYLVPLDFGHHLVPELYITISECFKILETVSCVIK